jgi:hypothetical protein
MAMKNTQRGFALLIAVIFMAVMLSFGLALGSLSYKQQILASASVQSQYAFYAADAGLECALYYDQKQNNFDYISHDGTTHPNPIICDGATADELPAPDGYSYNASRLLVKQRVGIDSGKRCVDVTVYKMSDGQTYIFSQGYDVSCATVAAAAPNGARFVSRGINIHY